MEFKEEQDKRAKEAASILASRISIHALKLLEDTLSCVGNYKYQKISKLAYDTPYQISYRKK